MRTFTIFGAGPAGLYTAWRLATSGALERGDRIELIEWGDYAFEAGTGTRLPAGRICTHHYGSSVENTYVEVGGMRFLQWDPSTSTGHKLVTHAIGAVGLAPEVVPFLTTDDPLFYLRGQTFYSKELESGTAVAPYNTPGNNQRPADELFAHISALITGQNSLRTRSEQCRFYSTGTLPSDTNSFVYRGGDPVGNIGYWNFFYDQAGNEGYNYAADAGGYSSNVINWNAADAAIYNGEFAPGGAFKTLRTGFSSLFGELYERAKAAAAAGGVAFSLTSGRRLHSIWSEQGRPTYRTASAAAPFVPEAASTSDYVFLAMPPHSLELVAQATRYADMSGKTDFLNARNVANYRESVLLQPSLKVAAFFDAPWWEESKYPPKLQGSGGGRALGPTITDLPLRQIYYFGNNAPQAGGTAVYGLLASYDDMRFAQFWREMDLPVTARRDIPISWNDQPLQGPASASRTLERMLLLELAKVHYGTPNPVPPIPTPLETVVMDWGLGPFGAGYHAWRAHYDIGDVMQKIRTPAQLGGAPNNVFLVGSAYSNDQAWVEGAFCTAESVLIDCLHLEPVTSTSDYPLICSG